MCSTVASAPASNEQHRGVTGWLARSLRELEVVGSIPAGPNFVFLQELAVLVFEGRKRIGGR